MLGIKVEAFFGSCIYGSKDEMNSIPTILVIPMGFIQRSEPSPVRMVNFVATD
jgi:hypothetical protein